MNELTRMAEFRSVLNDYKPSPAARKFLKGIKLVLLTAPTGGGRNTIINKLVASGDYHFVVSDTTRKPRVNNGIAEKNGVEYWFRTEEEMLDDLKRGEFLEAQIIHGQQVSGISIRELEMAQAQRRIAIDEVDTLGIANVLPVKPDMIGLLIIPPNFEEWLRRVESRGHMHPVERRRRFETAAEVFAMATNGTYPIVVNNKLEDAVAEVDAIVKNGHEDAARQKAARLLAEELYRATHELLEHTNRGDSA